MKGAQQTALPAVIFFCLLVLPLTVAGQAAAEAAQAYGPHAADSHYDAALMADARNSVRQMHGGSRNWLIQGDRVEIVAGDELLWDLQGWYGGRLHRAWLKTEGEAALDGGNAESVELQLLYSYAFRPYWNLQMGLRHDLDPDPSRTYLSLGILGLAPYWFEIDGALFLSSNRNLSGRVEAEYDLRLTQRWMLQPRAELNLAFGDDIEIGVGRGINTLALGLRLRYEITKDFAPYIGYEWTQSFGRTADLVDDPSSASLVAGIRFWL